MLSVGISIDSNALLGVNAGIAEAVGSIEGTLNNEFFFAIAIMFVGFAVGLGLLSTIIGLRRSNRNLVFILSQRNEMDAAERKSRAKSKAGGEAMRKRFRGLHEGFVADLKRGRK